MSNDEGRGMSELQDALKRLTTIPTGVENVMVYIEDLDVVTKAARRVANGKSISWCITHDHVAVPSFDGVCCRSDHPYDCHMVNAALGITEDTE